MSDHKLVTVDASKRAACSCGVVFDSVGAQVAHAAAVRTARRILAANRAASSS